MAAALSRKKIAATFLRMVATGKVDQAYERFVGAGFRHHNAYYPGDADSLRKGTKSAEFWDLGMEVPKDSPNRHGMF